MRRQAPAFILDNCINRYLILDWGLTRKSNPDRRKPKSPMGRTWRAWAS